VLQGGEDPWDALFSLVIFCQKIQHLVALLREMTCDSRHPMGLCHPVLETVRRVRKEGLDFFGFCWYLRIDNCVVQIISRLHI